jgi:hypothetical protein
VGNDRIFEDWTRLERCVQLIKRWSAGEGILFESKDGSHHKALFEVANMLGATRVMDVGLEARKKTEWRENFVRFVDGSHLPTFYETENDRICLVIPDLASIPEWMRSSLKFQFENAKRPFCCIAGIYAGADVDGSIASFFYHVEKVETPSQES